MADETDKPKPVARPPLYFRLINDLPVMVWASPDGDEAIIQFARNRPYIAMRYERNDANSLNVILIDLLAKTKALVSASDWHTAMGTDIWPDGEPVNWSKADA